MSKTLSEFHVMSSQSRIEEANRKSSLDIIREDIQSIPALIQTAFIQQSCLTDLRVEITREVFNRTVKVKWSLYGSQTDQTATDQARQDIVLFLFRCFDVGWLCNLASTLRLQNSSDLNVISEEINRFNAKTMVSPFQTNLPVDYSIRKPSTYMEVEVKKPEVIIPELKKPEVIIPELKKPEVAVYGTNDTKFIEEEIISKIATLKGPGSSNTNKAIILGVEYTRQSTPRISEWIDSLPKPLPKKAIVIFLCTVNAFAHKKDLENQLVKCGVEVETIIEGYYSSAVVNNKVTKCVITHDGTSLESILKQLKTSL